MNSDELEDMLADHLAGELPPEKRAAFEKAMASDPALRAEADSLQRTLAALAALGEEPVKRRAPTAGPTLLRYAAAAAIAFAAGWLLRGSPVPGSAPAPAPRASGPSDTHEWRVRFAQSYMEQPAGSDLARSLVAFSRASQ